MWYSRNFKKRFWNYEKRSRNYEKRSRNYEREKSQNYENRSWNDENRFRIHLVISRSFLVCGCGPKFHVSSIGWFTFLRFWFSNLFAFPRLLHIAFSRLSFFFNYTRASYVVGVDFCLTLSYIGWRFYKSMNSFLYKKNQ